MYNLEVEEAHTFFVGTQGWLVHNCDEIAKRELLYVLQAQLRKKAGFSDKGTPILIDENLTGSKLYNELVSRGYNVRSVEEVLGVGTPDEDILKFAQSAGVRVLTRDRGRQLDGGFGSLAIQLDRRVKSPNEIARVIDLSLKEKK
ncbi:DUF5615 family PIN-like protein [Deinococcus roseus]|uniref:DUF5615 domain-containing protein n=1 Tax=Deinococcus roseus TaxID=392414 RepID=A0ABQ2DHF5_9DEIO|nr:DUF5615 family PIN-like protein [Deinococcus roseus]GGJ57777.1 hypothetical protein GCM10008938_49850 [Deinococcus roseus]